MKRLTVVAFALGFAALAQGQTPPSIPHSIDGYLVTRQENSCLECHRGAKAKGGVNLAVSTNTASLFRDPKLWENSGRQLEERAMPPRDEEQPPEAVRLQLADTLTHLLDNPDPRLIARDPGAKVIHRLNRTEYNNTGEST